MDSPALRFRQQETYLMASIANDKAIIKELTEGSGDKRLFPYIVIYSKKLGKSVEKLKNFNYEICRMFTKI